MCWSCVALTSGGGAVHCRGHARRRLSPAGRPRGDPGSPTRVLLARGLALGGIRTSCSVAAWRASSRFSRCPRPGRDGRDLAASIAVTTALSAAPELSARRARQVSRGRRALAHAPHPAARRATTSWPSQVYGRHGWLGGLGLPGRRSDPGPPPRAWRARRALTSRGHRAWLRWLQRRGPGRVERLRAVFHAVHSTRSSCDAACDQAAIAQAADAPARRQLRRAADDCRETLASRLKVSRSARSRSARSNQAASSSGRRLLGHAVAAQVQRDDPEGFGELPRPAQPGLRPAVNEHDRRCLRVTPFADVQSEPAARPRVSRSGRAPASARR